MARTLWPLIMATPAASKVKATDAMIQSCRLDPVGGLSAATWPELDERVDGRFLVVWRSTAEVSVCVTAGAVAVILAGAAFTPSIRLIRSTMVTAGPGEWA